MGFSLKRPEHPAEKLPDIDIRGTSGTFHSRVAEVCPWCMRSLYQICSWRSVADRRNLNLPKS
jgi:hypothetical protein